MTGRTALLRLAPAVAAGLLVAAAPASAQCRLCSIPTTERLDPAGGSPMNLQVEATLDFDRLILVSGSEGTATLRPDGSRSVSGSIEGIGGRAMVGVVAVRGEAGRAVRVELPARIQLYSRSGATITIEELASDLPALPRLDSAGRLQFRFGGRLKIGGDAEGDYRGDVPIIVEYL